MLFAICNDVITNDYPRNASTHRIWCLLCKTQDDIDIGWIIAFFSLNWNFRNVFNGIFISNSFRKSSEFRIIMTTRRYMYIIHRSWLQQSCLEFTFVQINKIKASHVNYTRIFLFPFSHHITYFCIKCCCMPFDWDAMSCILSLNVKHGGRRRRRRRRKKNAIVEC